MIWGQVLLSAWATLALYYSNLPWTWLRLSLAVAFAAFCIWALWPSRRTQMRLVWAGLFVAALGWFIAFRPSHDRPWRPEVASLPRALIDGDRVRLTGVRNFDYRSADDFTVRYEEREVSLAHLTSMDLFISYWSVGPVAHTFVSFNFDNASPISISIEARLEKDEGFDPLAALFKQFELIYVVGEERDLVRVRTDYRQEEVYLYRIKAAPAAVRRLFLIYMGRINAIGGHAEWYHLLKNNCTVNIVRHANAAGRVGRYDYRLLLNGWVDRYLYDAGSVDTSLPFEALRRQSRIDDSARAAGDAPDFSARIRGSLIAGRGPARVP